MQDQIIRKLWNLVTAMILAQAAITFVLWPDGEANAGDISAQASTVQNGSAFSGSAVDCSALLSLPICPVTFEKEAVNLINKIRTDSGRIPLVWDYRLFVGARCHSVDMATHNCFKQDDCDGSPWNLRYSLLGYSNVLGQDIGAGFYSASDMVNAWMTSSDPYHRMAILNPYSTHIAVGYAAGGSYGSYWTSIYGTDQTTQTLQCGCCVGLTGNVDCDPNDAVDISDLSALIDNLYISFTPLCCAAEANIDGQPGTDISDLSALIDYLYITFTPTAACQ